MSGYFCHEFDDHVTKLEGAFCCSGLIGIVLLGLFTHGLVKRVPLIWILLKLLKVLNFLEG